MYKNLQLKKMQNPFQCGTLHLKFYSVNPDFKWGMSTCHVIIDLLMGEKEPFYFSPLIFFFLPWLVYKTESQQRGVEL